MSNPVGGRMKSLNVSSHLPDQLLTLSHTCYMMKSYCLTVQTVLLIERVVFVVDLLVGAESYAVR